MAANKKKKEDNKIIFPSSYQIIAADLSLRRPGFCRLSIKENIITNIETYYVDNKSNKITSHGVMLSNISNLLEKLIKESTPDIDVFFVREKAFNARASMAEIGIYKVIGIVDLLTYNLRPDKEWYEVFPVTVKKLVTGSGKADKLQVQKALVNYIGERTYDVDDESDSVAVALAFLIQNNQIESKPLDEFKQNEK